MSINAATSSVGTTSSTSSVANSQGTETTKKSSTDSSFKDEMDKVSSSEKTEKKEDKNTKEVDIKKDSKDSAEINDSEKSETSTQAVVDSKSVNTGDENSKFASLSMNDVNAMLSNDIQQMINTNNVMSVDQLDGLSVFNSESAKNAGMLSLDFTDNVSMTQNDAQFFIDLAQNNTLSAQTVMAQAQMALDNGVEFSQVQQNVKISETLLNAINTARETNQPLRIDFDQNVSIILRLGKDGSFAANFIPGDKAVEQYLKNNIDSLKATFEEKELPYSDLSYSSRGGKRQKEERRNQQ